MVLVINLHVKVSDMALDGIGNNDYKDITGEAKTSSIKLKSNADVTTCTYNVKFTTKENTFENKYNSGTLKNQLMLNLEGYETQNGVTTKKSY